MKRAFTIVELLVVIGVIIVLMGIVTTAASESMKASRSRRRDALISLVQAGLAAYYAQNDEWPISFRGKSGNIEIKTSIWCGDPEEDEAAAQAINAKL